MLIKTSELIGSALDYAVAKCEGYRYCTKSGLLYKHKEPHFFKPYSSDWLLSGDIIEREEIGFAKYGPNNTWKAVIGATPRGVPCFGSTALIAVMRCYVTSKLGEAVEIPEELMQ